MKVWLLYPHTTPRQNNAFGWFREAFARKGAEVEVFFWNENNHSDFGLVSEDGVRSEVEQWGNNLPEVVFMRGYNLLLSRWLEGNEVRVINSSASMELCRDKIATARKLEAAGLPTPRIIPAEFRLGEAINTVSATPSETVSAEFEKVSAKFGGMPFILKLNFGSKGEDVYLIENKEQYYSALEQCNATRKRRLSAISEHRQAGHPSKSSSCPEREEVEKGCQILFQEYISESRGRDLRVWVVGNEVAGHLLRHNEHSFKSNFAQGATPSQYPLPQEAAKLAITATKCLGLVFAGVDLLFLNNPTDPYNSHFTICEVNGNAGFRTSSIVGGMDIPKLISDKLY